MVRLRTSVALASLLAVLALASPGTRAAVTAAGVSLKVSHEAAPPGAIAQVKVRVTEPKPITTASAFLAFHGFSQVVGIALSNVDAAGVAEVNGGRIGLSIRCPSGTCGMQSDYPIVTVSGRVPLAAPLGTRFPMVIDPAAVQFLSPAGDAYPPEIESGSLLVANRLSIGNVVPGSATLPAGAVVSIHGTRFEPTTRIRFNETLLAQVRYLGPTRMDVVLAQPARMHGMRIRARNMDGSEAVYFAYQRRARAGTSTHPVLKSVYPVFPLRTMRTASVPLPRGDAGLALQNPEGLDTAVTVDLATTTGRIVASAVVAVPANRYVVQSLAEIFGFPTVGPAILRVTAPTPVQALGVALGTAGRPTPVIPR